VHTAFRSSNFVYITVVHYIDNVEKRTLYKSWHHDDRLVSAGGEPKFLAVRVIPAAEFDGCMAATRPSNA
jgi:hypothetical protein